MAGISQAQAGRLRKGEVVCEGCGEPFKMRPQMSPWGEGGECHWFRCTHCERRYVMAYITAKGVKVRGWIKALKARLAEMPAGQERAALGEEWESLQEMMAAEVTSGEERDG